MARGSFMYLPDPDYFGSDTFSYQALDSSGGLSPAATVTIAVSDDNRVPAALDDSYATVEDNRTGCAGCRRIA